MNLEIKEKVTGSIKWVWWFLKEELPQFLSNWRTVPRLMMVLYGTAFYEVVTWFMALENTNNAQAGLVSVVVGGTNCMVWVICQRQKTNIQK